MTDVVEFIRARLREREQRAREASRREDEGPYTEGGEHWQWECTEHDALARLDPLTDVYAVCPVDENCFRFSLRSVEQYETPSVGSLPHFVIHQVEELPAIVGLHVVEHDPATVLAEVAALRAVVNQAEMLAEYVDATREHEAYRYEPTLHRLLAPLAGIWADHPDYDPAWGA